MAYYWTVSSSSYGITLHFSLSSSSSGTLAWFVVSISWVHVSSHDLIRSYGFPATGSSIRAVTHCAGWYSYNQGNMYTSCNTVGSGCQMQVSNNYGYYYYVYPTDLTVELARYGFSAP
jgi:hypothetical protein